MARRKAKTRSKDAITGRVRAADPFELIRWLAQSQPDPRKALAELVQNAIDAQARHIRVTRQRERGEALLRILDDGEGVIPELGRTEALKYVATHIGHSRKCNLTPEQRRELMMVGKYGIGLLGFWAIGKGLEMRTQIPGEPAFVLRMFEDSPRFEIDRARGRLALGERYTEITVRDLHGPAFSSLTARRMRDFLAIELRGQLLARDIEVIVHDRIARGRAPKILEVQPLRFEGWRLPVPEEVATVGFSSVKIELYLTDDSQEQRKIAISSGGTVVYEDLTQFEVADLGHEPWTDARLSGVVEFADFQIAPGARRGVIPDQAALAFATALRGLESEVEQQIQAVEEKTAAEIEEGLLRRLEKAFRDVPRLAPEYDFFAVRARRDRPLTTAEPAASREDNDGKDGGGDVGSGAPEGFAVPEGPAPGEEEAVEPELLVAGPLASLSVVPSPTRVERLGQRRLHVDACDNAGTRIRSGLHVQWRVASDLARVEPAEGRSTVVHAGPLAGVVTVVATASQDGQSLDAEGEIEIVEEMGTSDAGHTGIPEPVFVEESGSTWRSRMREGSWEVNSAHADFRAAAETPRRKLRYLTALLAKEVVLHSFPSPQLGPTLERLVEVLTIVERRLERR